MLKVPKKSYGFTCEKNNECRDWLGLECGIPTECQCDVSISDCECPAISTKSVINRLIGGRLSGAGNSSSNSSSNSTKNEYLQNYCTCTKQYYFNSSLSQCEPEKDVNETCDFSFECKRDIGLGCYDNVCSLVFIFFYDLNNFFKKKNASK